MRRKIPNFNSDQEEAAWWDRNRTELDDEFAAAAERGELRRLDGKLLQERLSGGTRVVSLRISEEDLGLARKQAEKKGLPYQTYIKHLLHDALRQAG